MSHGTGWLIMKCAQLREKGYTFDQLIAYCEDMKYRIKHLRSVEDLQNLIRSGRISSTSAMIGKILSIHPIMTMKDTKGFIVAKKRGHQHVLRSYIEDFKKRVDEKESDFIIMRYHWHQKG